MTDNIELGDDEALDKALVALGQINYHGSDAATLRKVALLCQRVSIETSKRHVMARKLLEEARSEHAMSKVLLQLKEVTDGYRQEDNGRAARQGKVLGGAKSFIRSILA